MIKKIDWKPLMKTAQAEFDLVVGIVREKGGKRFSKAFGLAGICVVISYFGIYKYPRNKAALLTYELDKARAMSDVGAQYKEIRDQLGASYAILPQMTDRDQWLSNAMMDVLRAKGLTPDSVRPVGEAQANELIFQTSTIELTIRFEELYALLTRLESNRPLMHIQNLDVQKKAEPLGSNTATISVTTVIPKKRFN